MSTEHVEGNAEFPASEPGIERYDRYRILKLKEKEFMLYDTELEDGWIKSHITLDLSSWR